MSKSLSRFQKYFLFGVLPGICLVCVLILNLQPTDQAVSDGEKVLGRDTVTAEPISTPTALPIAEPTATHIPLPTATSGPDIGSNTEAEVVCQDFVLDNLKSPSTASFGGWLDDWDTAVFVSDIDDLALIDVEPQSLTGTGVWVIYGQVDSENGFGAMIRSEYYCILDYDKNTKKYHLLDIVIG